MDFLALWLLVGFGKECSDIHDGEAGCGSQPKPPGSRDHQNTARPVSLIHDACACTVDSPAGYLFIVRLMSRERGSWVSSFDRCTPQNIYTGISFFFFLRDTRGGLGLLLPQSNTPHRCRSTLGKNFPLSNSSTRLTQRFSNQPGSVSLLSPGQINSAWWVLA